MQHMVHTTVFPSYVLAPVTKTSYNEIKQLFLLNKKGKLWDYKPHIYCQKNFGFQIPKSLTPLLKFLHYEVIFSVVFKHDRPGNCNLFL